MPRYENSKTRNYVEVDSYGYIREGVLGESRPTVFKEISIDKAKQMQKELLEKGFVDVGLAGFTWDFKPNHELEAKILDDRTKKDAYKNYATWLEKNGQTALSELISLGGFEYDKVRQRQFFGETDLYMDIQTWQFGFVKNFQSVSDRDISELENFLDLPLLRFLEILSVCQGDITEFFEFLQTWQGLKHLEKLNVWDEDACGIGDLNEILPLLKHLEIFYLVGTIYELGEIEEIEIKCIDFPNLEQFARVSINLTLKELQAITYGSWPKLHSLTLGIGFDSEIVAEDFSEFLQGKNFPLLKRLAIRHCDDIDDLIKLLVDSPLLRQLSHLDFSESDLSSKGAKVLQKNQEKFSHLEYIGIRNTILAEDDEQSLCDAFSSIEPYNALREKGKIPYFDAIYQERFWECYDDEEDD